MTDNIGNYAKHARFWDWSGRDQTGEHEYWRACAAKYGSDVLIPMCALAETGVYMARHGMRVAAFDITPEMIDEARKRFGDVENLTLLVGDVRTFAFDIPPADFCYCMDFGHLLTMEDVKKALARINAHLRDGGGLVIETTLPPAESHRYSAQTYMPETQIYPGLTVWKTGEGRVDAATGRHYISQRFHARDGAGRVETFDHSFYLQSYPREAWLAALEACGFTLAAESAARATASWQSGGDGFRIFEAVKQSPPS